MAQVTERSEPPRTVRGYLAQLIVSRVVLVWAWETIGARSRRKSYALILTLISSSLVSSFIPRAVAGLTDALIARDAGGARNFVYLMAVLMIVSRLLWWYLERIREFMLNANRESLELRINQLVSAKSVSQHHQFSHLLDATTIQRGRDALIRIQNLIAFAALPTFTSMLIAYLLIWSALWWAAVALTVVVLTYFAWSLYLNRWVGAVAEPLEDEFRHHLARMKERWILKARVHTSGHTETEVEDARSSYADLSHRNKTFWDWYIDVSLARGVISTIGFAGVMGIGAYAAWNGRMSTTMLLPLFAWSKQLLDNLWLVGETESQINHETPTVSRMITGLMLDPDVVLPPDGFVIPDGASITIAFAGVSHVYPQGTDPHDSTDPTHPPALRDVSFTVESGECVALVGASGSGKTTLTKLLLRFMHPSTGEILVNGTLLRDLDHAAFARATGYMPQGAQLFNDTLRYNLTYGLSPAERAAMTDEQLWAVCNELQCNFGARLTQGLDTRIGDKGVLLSGGEAQRVMIAAAVIKRPRFVVMDEITSHLDSTTELAVQQGLRNMLVPGVSALIIAHRLSTVRACTKFVVLRNVHEVPPGGSQVEGIYPSFETAYAESPILRRLANDQGIVLPHLAAADSATA